MKIQNNLVNKENEIKEGTILKSKLSESYRIVITDQGKYALLNPETCRVASRWCAYINVLLNENDTYEFYTNDSTLLLDK